MTPGESGSMPNSPDLHSELPLADRTLSLPDGLLSIARTASASQFVLRTKLADATGVGAAFGAALPTTVGRAAAQGSRAALCLGPDEWLLIAEDGAQPLVTAVFAAFAGAFPFSLAMSAIATSRSSFWDRPRSTVLATGFRLILIRARFRKMPAPALSSPSAKSCFGVVGGELSYGIRAFVRRLCLAIARSCMR